MHDDDDFRPIILIHVPKTAGTAMYHSLRLHFGESNCLQLARADIYRAYQYPKKRVYMFGHIGVWHLFDRRIFCRRLYNQSFKFCFIRNPWDRLVSVYEHYRTFRLSRTIESNKYLQSWDAFIKGIQKPEIVDREQLQLRTSNTRLCLAKPQTLWTHQPGISFVGRYEHIKRDWANLLDRLNLPPIELVRKRVHRRRRRPYQSYYSERQVDIVAELYRDEIEEYGYAF